MNDNEEMHANTEYHTKLEKFKRKITKKKNETEIIDECSKLCTPHICLNKVHFNAAHILYGALLPKLVLNHALPFCTERM